MFGCTVYVHVPKDERGKLDPKTRKCLLLGYGSVQKGYRVFDPVTRKVSFSRNVTFDEQESGRPPIEEEVESAQRPLILEPIDKSESDCEGEDDDNGSTNEDPPAVEVQPRRSTRQTRPVNYYGFPQANLTIHCEPTTFEEATNCPEKAIG